MQQLGYLTRDHPQDQRFKRVYLTERGHAAEQAIRETVAEIEAELETNPDRHSSTNCAGC